MIVLLGSCPALACEGVIGDTGGDLPDFVMETPGGGTCVDVEEMFDVRLWRPTVSRTCLGCHNVAGAARESGLLFVGGEEPGYLETNLTAIRRVAIERAGEESLLLAKVSGSVDHAGGVLAPRGSPTFEVFDELVHAIELGNECTEADHIPTGPYFDGVVVLDEAQTLRKAMFQLASRYPTAAELDAVRGRGIDALDPILDQAMHEEGFYVRIKEIFNDVLLTEGLIYPIYKLPEAADPVYRAGYAEILSVSEDQRERYAEELGKMMVSEPLNLVVWVLRNDRPFSEILTADYTILNPYSARYYGVSLDHFRDAQDPNEWIAHDLPDRPEAGILSTVSFLETYPSTQTNRNRARARVVYKIFLDTNVLALDAEPLPVAAVSEPAAWMHNPACTVCHDRVDPVAGAFQNYNDYADRIGRYRVPADGWYTDMRAPGFNGADTPAEEAGRALPWLARQIVDDRRFALAMVGVAYLGLTGQAPLVEPTDPDDDDYAIRLRPYDAQRETFQAAADLYLAAGHDLRVAIRAIVKSPWFRAIDATIADEARLEELGALGTARILTPEGVARRLRAIFGYPIFEDIERVWTGGARGFKLLYGGIDSRGSRVRATEMNAVMAGIADRMANEVSCQATPREFARPSADRVLFPRVETSDDAVGAREAVLETIVELHERFFGERLAPDDPEIVRTFELFRDVQATGQSEIASRVEAVTMPTMCGLEGLSEDPTYAVRAWMAVVTYLLSDYRFLYD
jgi:hypothetical protein